MKKDKFDINLFKNPRSDFRSAPFWAWNSKLEKDELINQIKVFKEMGFGGFHMHVRTGMETKYLSNEFFNHVKTCVNFAKENNMKAYLYDEDRWPSGSAGGLITKNDEYRELLLLFSPEIINSNDFIFIKSYIINQNQDGYLTSFELNKGNNSNTFYAYLFKGGKSSWHNNESYVDTLNKEAIDEFIKITYQRYYDEVGNEFGNTIPSIFTDEPHSRHKDNFKNSFDKVSLKIPWTKNLEDIYKKRYNDSLIDNLPYLFFSSLDEKDKLVKYNYHNLICDLFASSYMKNISSWCKNHNIAFTGHLDEEPTLLQQVAEVGDLMRLYKYFDIPGVDMLQRKMEFNTLKQCESIVNQYNKEGMMSELYGVTSYEFDFRDYLLHGDFEEALGVTLRVPHLSWYSMKGEAKRDYPASYNYHAPFYKELPYLEDHFARLNSILKRGKRIVNIGVINPIETMFINYGPDDLTKKLRDELDKNYKELTNLLLFNQLDFDFINEALLPEIESILDYQCLIIPFMETIRDTTILYLEKAIKRNIKVIFYGDIPKYVNAILNRSLIEQLSKNVTFISLSPSKLLNELEPYRDVSIKDLNGNAFNLIYQLRDDDEQKWLFISHAIEVRNKDISVHYDNYIKVKGIYKPTLFDTITGCTSELEHYTKNGITYINVHDLYEFTSLLIKLDFVDESHFCIEKEDISYTNVINIPNQVYYELDEMNAIVLDKASLVLDGVKNYSEQDILKLDDKLRDDLGFERRKKDCTQPWAFNEDIENHDIILEYNIYSEIDYEDAYIALENFEETTIIFNDNVIEKYNCGFYKDKCIKKTLLGNINKGLNSLKLCLKYNQQVDLENVFILGYFGATVKGKYGVITDLQDKISFGDITNQGLPFYSGNITYMIPINITKDSFIVHSNYYKGSLLKVALDNDDFEYITIPPYDKIYKNVTIGEHVLKLKLFGHNQNSFGPLHLMDYKQMPSSPSTFRSEDEKWSEEFITRPIGILKSPIIKE